MYPRLFVSAESGDLELHFAPGQLILFRRDTAEAWAASTHPIHANEPVFCTTTRVLKLGDGVRGFADLPVLAQF